MELTGNLKKKVEKAETRDEAKGMIKTAMEDAGMVLSDEELDRAVGGMGPIVGINDLIRQ